MVFDLPKTGYEVITRNMGNVISACFSPVFFCYKQIICNNSCCCCTGYTTFNVNAARFSLLSYKTGDRFILFPDGNGRLHVVDLFREEPTSDIYFNVNGSEFHLYTRLNKEKPQQLFTGDTESLKISNLDVNKPTIIVIHGWRSKAEAPVNLMVKKAALESSDVNVILFVWSSEGWYTSANRRTPEAGQTLATFIDFLAVSGLSYSKIHLIGFSVGAHVAGYAGRNTKYGKVMRITALDPSNPGWYDREDRLSKNDCVYLEVLHTNAGYLGIKEAIGHADFFINGGTCQPGRTPFNISFSHSRCYKIFTETIGNEDFIGEQCTTVYDAIQGRINGAGNMVMGGISPYKNGELNNKNKTLPGSSSMGKKDGDISSGIYYIETNVDPPFAKN